MGRASRKKNRLRGIDGGVYSKLWKHEKAHKTFKAIESGKSVMLKMVHQSPLCWNCLIIF